RFGREAEEGEDKRKREVTPEEVVDRYYSDLSHQLVLLCSPDTNSPVLLSVLQASEQLLCEADEEGGRTGTPSLPAYMDTLSCQQRGEGLGSVGNHVKKKQRTFSSGMLFRTFSKYPLTSSTLVYRRRIRAKSSSLMLDAVWNKEATLPRRDGLNEVEWSHVELTVVLHRAEQAESVFIGRHVHVSVIQTIDNVPTTVQTGADQRAGLVKTEWISLSGGTVPGRLGTEQTPGECRG
ncbi:hypothetical protein INR49_028445, partial [Caranx melampygus]